MVGEFQKRIKEHGYSHVEEYPTVLVEDLEDWVDEAKKEFPEIKQRWVQTKGSKVDWKRTCEVMERRIILREKWFEEWFINGKKE